MMGDFYNYGYGYGPSYGHMFGIGSIFMIIFWILVIWIVIALIRMAVHGGHMRHGHWHGFYKGTDDMAKSDKALDILKERFAKGDIAKEEFEEKKKILSS